MHERNADLYGVQCEENPKVAAPQFPEPRGGYGGYRGHGGGGYAR